MWRSARRCSPGGSVEEENGHVAEAVDSAALLPSNPEEGDCCLETWELILTRLRLSCFLFTVVLTNVAQIEGKFRTLLKVRPSVPYEQRAGPGQ